MVFATPLPSVGVFRVIDAGRILVMISDGVCGGSLSLPDILEGVAVANTEAIAKIWKSELGGMNCFHYRSKTTATYLGPVESMSRVPHIEPSGPGVYCGAHDGNGPMYYKFPLEKGQPPVNHIKLVSDAIGRDPFSPEWMKYICGLLDHQRMAIRNLLERYAPAVRAVVSPDGTVEITDDRCLARFRIGKDLAEFAQRHILDIAQTWSQGAAGGFGACFNDYTVEPGASFVGVVSLVRDDFTSTLPVGRPHRAGWYGSGCEEGMYNSLVYLYTYDFTGRSSGQLELDTARGVPSGSDAGMRYICGRVRDIRERIIISLKKKMREYQDDLDLL